MADYSPSQQLHPPGTRCSRCGTNPSFTQDLQNAPQEAFFLNRLYQVKGLAESKGRVLPTTIHPQGTGHLTRLNSLTKAPPHFGGVSGYPHPEMTAITCPSLVDSVAKMSMQGSFSTQAVGMWGTRCRVLQNHRIGLDVFLKLIPSHLSVTHSQGKISSQLPI